MIEAYNEYIQKLIDSNTSIHNRDIKELELKISKIKEEIRLLKEKLLKQTGFFKKKERQKTENEINKKNIELSNVSDELRRVYNEIYKQVGHLDVITPRRVLKSTDLKEIYDFLVNKKITFSFNKYDLQIFKNICYREKKYENFSDLVLVHKTDFIPGENKILIKKSGAIHSGKIKILGNKYEYKFLDETNNFIHFSINGEVNDQYFGDSKECKYAYIIPFDKINREHISKFNFIDTCYNDDIDLPESTIFLCPKKESEEIRIANLGLRVFSYDDSNVSGYGNLLMVCLGYTHEKNIISGWIDEKSQRKVLNVLGKDNLQFKEIPYDDSAVKFSLNKLFSILDILKSNEIINSSNVESIVDELYDQEIIKKEHLKVKETIKYLISHGLVTDSFLEKSLKIDIVNNKSKFIKFIIYSVLETMCLENKLEEHNKNKKIS